MIKRILVVCVGNICRSPMAEGLLKRALPGHEISSAGLSAMTGYGADQIAVQIMSEQGIDIGMHRARMVTDVLMKTSDLILVMDSQQLQQISVEYPYTRGKVFRLGESVKRDIPDPYRQDYEVFRSVFDLIVDGSSAWVKRINNIG